MVAQPIRVSASRPSLIKAILLAGLVCGALDITGAFVTAGYRGVPPVRVLQSVAAGLLGAPSYQGGWNTAALGLALHFLIATIWASVYGVASRWLKVLVKHPIFIGPFYGVWVNQFMNWVVLPLSALPPRQPTTYSIVAGLIVHILCVGLPIALVVSNFSKPGNQ